MITIGANATETTDTLGAVENAISEAVGTSSEMAELATVDGALVFETDTSNISINLESSSEDITIASEVGDLSFSIATTDVLNSEEATVSDGVVQLANPSEGNSFVLEAEQSGDLRVSTVIENRDASHSQKYDFDSNVQPELNLDGSVSLFTDNGSGEMTLVSQIDIPWAIDAKGDSVATHFTVEWTSVMQTTDQVSTDRYPVVADPYFLKWSGINAHILFTKADAQKVLQVKQSYIAAAGVICGMVGSVYGAAACGFSAVRASAILAEFEKARTNRQCVVLQIAPIGVSGWYRTSC